MSGERTKVTKGKQMKKKKMIQIILAVFAAAFVLTGCGSMRVATTLKPDPEMREQQIADGVKFSIVQFDARQDREKTSNKLMFGSIDIAPVTAVNAPVLQKHAAGVYPRLFGNDFADLPVSLDVDCKCSNYEWGEWFQVLTYGTIPLFPAWINVDCEVHTWVWGEDGCVVNETDSFTQKFSWWRTFYTPLGILPVPGFSDLRATSFGGFLSLNKTYSVRSKELSMDSLTEAATQSIRRTDPAKLKAALESRKARIRQIDINGQTFWSFLGFGFSKSKDQPDVASLFLYREYPTWDAKPVEQVVVARLADGKWQPVTSYLRSIKELTAAGVLLADGKPSKVIIRKVDKPPLEDFIELPQGCTECLSWSNDVLIEVKNRTLSRLIQKESPEYLIKLITRIEKAILELNKQAQMADSRVQQMVVEGKGADPTQANELSVLCRQRISIFKPILSALKQGVAARGR